MGDGPSSAAFTHSLYGSVYAAVVTLSAYMLL
jgi:hypothetical protein